jgi:hypothetical protein
LEPFSFMKINLESQKKYAGGHHGRDSRL